MTTNREAHSVQASQQPTTLEPWLMAKKGCGMQLKVKSRSDHARPLSPPYLDNRVFQKGFLLLVAAILMTFLAAMQKTANSRQSKLNSSKPPCSDINYKIVPQHQDRSVSRYAAFCGDEPLSIQSWTMALASDPANSHGIMNIIRDSPFEAVFFETKGCDSANWQTKQFEFVLVDAPHLRSFAESSPDPQAFAEHMSASCCETLQGCAFPNMGGDAQLIVPCAAVSQHRAMLKNNNIEEQPHLVAYSHLAAFCRQAPIHQVSRVWQLAAKEYQHRVNGTSKTVWLSTSGTGIAWLHFRLDSRPKYYQYKPFQSET
ncbi:hypothetical protein MHU86_16112 [Fragilaria crotonensis]|nr:hypothetical protein MHU86_16112 [Fragilaria crotonensis]